MHGVQQSHDTFISNFFFFLTHNTYRKAIPSLSANFQSGYLLISTGILVNLSQTMQLPRDSQQLRNTKLLVRPGSCRKVLNGLCAGWWVHLVFEVLSTS
jgi:hypothetical protein